MRTVMFALAGGSAWLVLGYKLRDLARDRHNPFLRSFCATMLLVAAAFTVGLPPVISRLEQATGILGIWATGVVVAGSAAVHTTLLLWAHPPDEAWPRIRPRWALHGVALASMVALSLAGRVHPTVVDIRGYAETPDLLYGRTPYVNEAMLIYIAILAYATYEMTRFFWRYADLADRRWLRRGLRLVAVCAIVQGGYCLAFAVFMVGMRFGVTLPVAQSAEQGLAGVSVLIAAVGTTMPAWGPRIDRIIAYRRLHPLWLALYRAAPEVVLDAPSSARADRWTPWDLNYRLYRRIIEIRDSCLALRPYRDPAVATRVCVLGRQAGLAGVDLNAVVEAATLAAAIQAKSTGSPVAEQFNATDKTIGGHDMTSELTWLTKVAAAFVNPPAFARHAVPSPVVGPAVVVGRTSAEESPRESALSARYRMGTRGKSRT